MKKLTKTVFDSKYQDWILAYSLDSLNSLLLNKVAFPLFWIQPLVPASTLSRGCSHRIYTTPIITSSIDNSPSYFSVTSGPQLQSHHLFI